MTTWHTRLPLTIKEVERYTPDPYDGRQGSDCSRRWKETTIFDSEGKEVDIIKDENMRNFIVECVNAYDELVVKKNEALSHALQLALTEIGRS